MHLSIGAGLEVLIEYFPLVLFRSESLAGTFDLVEHFCSGREVVAPLKLLRLVSHESHTSDTEL